MNKLKKLCEEVQETVNPSYEREKEVSRQINQLVVDDSDLKSAIDEAFKAAFDKCLGELDSPTGNDKATVAEKVNNQISRLSYDAQKRAGAANW